MQRTTHPLAQTVKPRGHEYYTCRSKKEKFNGSDYKFEVRLIAKKKKKQPTLSQKKVKLKRIMKKIVMGLKPHTLSHC